MNPLADAIQAGSLNEQDTAFVAFDLDVLLNRLTTLRSSFPEGFQHAVAIKTNPQLEVLSFILSCGFNLEAASMEELKLAVRAGAAGDQLVFDSPVKTRAEIAWCAEHLTGLMLNVNRLEELSRMPKGHGFRLGIRINPMVSASGDAMYDVSTTTSKFGVPFHQRSAIFRAVRDHDVLGLHLHVGSGATHGEGHLKAVRNVLSLAQEIDAELVEQGKAPLSFLNIGGGLAAAAGEQEMRKYGAAIGEMSAKDGRSWSTEFGQWVHEPAGQIFSRVEYCESPQGQKPGLAYLHIGADMMVRQVYHKKKPLKVSVFDGQGQLKGGAVMSYRLVGPLCFAGDVLSESVELPKLEENDWVCLSEMGANTLGLWSRHCSRAVPKVMVRHPKGMWMCAQERTQINF